MIDLFSFRTNLFICFRKIWMLREMRLYVKIVLSERKPISLNNEVNNMDSRFIVVRRKRGKS